MANQKNKHPKPGDTFWYTGTGIPGITTRQNKTVRFEKETAPGKWQVVFAGYRTVVNAKDCE